MKNGVYKYNGSVCGASFAIPQIAGLFLLSRQIYKEIRFNEFIEIIKHPQMVNKDGTNYINANEIIKQVEKNRDNRRKKEIDTVSYFHDQKSDVFYRDESNGVNTVPRNLISSNIEKSMTNIASSELVGQEVISGSKIQGKNVKDIHNGDHKEYGGK